MKVRQVERPGASQKRHFLKLFRKRMAYLGSWLRNCRHVARHMGLGEPESQPHLHQNVKDRLKIYAVTAARKT